MTQRNCKATVRLTESEHRHLKKRAEQFGLSAEALIRSLIMGLEVKPIPPEKIAELLLRMSAIGNSINLIARDTNITGHVEKEDIDAIKTMLEQLLRQIKSIKYESK